MARSRAIFLSARSAKVGTGFAPDRALTSKVAHDLIQKPVPLFGIMRSRDQQKWVPVLRSQSSLRRLRRLICGSRANLLTLRMIFIGEPVPTSPDHAAVSLSAGCPSPAG